MTDTTGLTLSERLRVPVMMHSNPAQTNAERREAAAALDAQAALVKELAEALEPFSKIGLWRDHYPDAKNDELTAQQIQGYVQVPDIRRARAALTKYKEAQP